MSTLLERETTTKILPDALLYIDGEMRPARAARL